MHEGWNNYETWAVACWIDENEKSYWRSAQVAVADLASILKQDIEDGIPLEQPSLYGDLLSAALSEVDWHEIAEHCLGIGDREDSRNGRS